MAARKDLVAIIKVYGDPDPVKGFEITDPDGNPLAPLRETMTIPSDSKVFTITVITKSPPWIHMPSCKWYKV